MGLHRRERVRPRYGRVGAAVVSLVVTAIALMGGIGILPSSADNTGPGPSIALDSAADATDSSSLSLEASSSASSGASATSAASGKGQKGPTASKSPTASSYPLPGDSGTGRRVVFSESEQRVWLVADDGSIERTYLVSGSLTDNLDPGTFSVYSRSEQAWGIDDSGTMQWFVRFTKGDAGAAIGFHSIPVDNGTPVQTLEELGTPQSHGCIRQKSSDALALWEFAPVATTVVVIA
jgi:hypothetical protein